MWSTIRDFPVGDVERSTCTYLYDQCRETVTLLKLESAAKFVLQWLQRESCS